MPLYRFLQVGWIVVTACGWRDREIPVDATVDAIGQDDATNAGDAAATGVVHVVVQNIGSVSGLAVSFGDPSGIPTMQTTTDSNGAATGTIIAGGSVTVVTGTISLPSGNTITLATVLGVQPGDNLVFGPDTPWSPPPFLGNAQIDLPGAFTNAASYSVSAGCVQQTVQPADVSTTIDLPLSTACLNAAGMFDVVAVARDANGQPLAYADAFGVSPPPFFSATTLSLPTWRTDFDLFTVATQNTPPNVASLDIDLGALDGAQLLWTSTSTNQTWYGSSQTAQLVAPMGAFSSCASSVVLTRLGAKSTSTLVARTASLASSTIDLGSDMLPFLHDLVVSFPAGRGAAALEWLSDASTSQAQGYFSLVEYTDRAGDAIIEQIELPPSAVAPVALPEIPDSLDAYRPRSATVSSAASLYAISGTFWRDAADLRQHSFRLFGLTSQTLPDGDTLLTSYVFP